MKKKIIIAVAVVLMITGLIFTVHKPKNRDEIKLFGNVEIRTVDLGFRVDGRIKKMFFHEGDEVKKGDLLATLEPTAYAASYKKSLSEIESASVNAQNAVLAFNIHRPLCVDGTDSKEQCNAISRNKKDADAKLKIAKEQSIIAKDNLDNVKIYAPNDGIVTTRILEEGSIALPSSPVYTVSLSKPVWVRAFISEKYLGNIQYGQKATVITDSIDPKTGKKREYVGYVGYISPVAEFTPKTVQTEELRDDLVYRMRIYIFENDKFLRQGMPVTVKANLKEQEIKDLKNMTAELD